MGCQFWKARWHFIIFVPSRGCVPYCCSFRCQRLSWHYGKKNGRPENLIPWNESRMPNWNSCRISDSNGGIEKPTIKHMGIKIIVRSVGGHDRRQMGTNQCAPLQHPGRQFDVLPAWATLPYLSLNVQHGILLRVKCCAGYCRCTCGPAAPSSERRLGVLFFGGQSSFRRSLLPYLWLPLNSTVPLTLSGRGPSWRRCGPERQPFSCAKPGSSSTASCPVCNVPWLEPTPGPLQR